MTPVVGTVLASSCGLGELGREALDPAVDRDVVDLDPALAQELLDRPGKTGRTAGTSGPPG